MAETLTPDICVIGGGPRRLVGRRGRGCLRRANVLIEREAMGGDSLNTGSIPSKALLAAARRAEAIRGAAVFGLEVQKSASISPR